MKIAVFSAMALMASAGAFADEFSVVTVTAQNGDRPLDIQPNAEANDSSLVDLDATYNFNGLMINGQAATMTYAVTASAQALDGGLQASYSTSLSNALYNTANSPYDPSTGTGVPTALSGQAVASFTDVVAIAGDQALAKIRLRVEMDGSLEQSSGSYPYQTGYAALWQKLAPDAASSAIIPGSRVDTFPGGAYTNTVLTDFYEVVGGTATVDLLLQTTNSWLLDTLAQGENAPSETLFFNKARVVGVEGYDNLGNSVLISSANGAAGTDYLNVSEVPLPAAAWMLLSGLGALGAMVRRRHLATA